MKQKQLSYNSNNNKREKVAFARSQPLSIEVSSLGNAFWTDTMKLIVFWALRMKPVYHGL